MKKIVRILLFLLFIALLAAGGVYLWYTNGISAPNSTSTERKEFTVNAGANIDQIGNDLKTAGLIGDKNLLWIY